MKIPSNPCCFKIMTNSWHVPLYLKGTVWSEATLFVIPFALLHYKTKLFYLSTITAIISDVTDFLYFFRTCICSEDLDKHFREYMSMTVEEAAESDCPMMFISFPSAKDPNWELKYPGKYKQLAVGANKTAE